MIFYRNLCALEWTNTNPKGTTDQFSAYYDSLSAEEKEVSSQIVHVLLQH